jgi:cytochrome c-type biogenesis protein CcmH
MLPVAVLALLALATPGLAAAPQVGIADIEDEVMCPICGTLLELAYSPQAERQRVYVKRLIVEGKTKAQIKDALVAQYGREVLALPEGSGFSLSAYLIPVIAFLAAIAALTVGVLRWRRHTSQPGSTPTPPRGADAERLDADLSRYDL